MDLINTVIDTVDTRRSSVAFYFRTVSHSTAAGGEEACYQLVVVVVDVHVRVPDYAETATATQRLRREDAVCGDSRETFTYIGVAFMNVFTAPLLTGKVDYIESRD